MLTSNKVSIIRTWTSALGFCDISKELSPAWECVTWTIDVTKDEIYAVQAWDMILSAGSDDDTTPLDMALAFIDVGHNPDQLSESTRKLLVGHFHKLAILED